jgi:hypothetical protein
MFTNGRVVEVDEVQGVGEIGEGSQRLNVDWSRCSISKTSARTREFKRLCITTCKSSSKMSILRSCTFSFKWEVSHLVNWNSASLVRKHAVHCPSAASSITWSQCKRIQSLPSLQQVRRKIYLRSWISLLLKMLKALASWSHQKQLS